VKKAILRDAAILEAIDLCGVMDTEQLTELLFKSPSGKRKCQERMKSLYERGLVKKTRLSLNTPTVYYQGKLTGLPFHNLGLSWIYVWFNRRPGEKILTWELDQLEEFGLKVDVLCSTYIPMTKEVRWYIIEYCRGSVSKNKYLKVSNCDELYLKEGFPNSKLMKRLDGAVRFPKAILVTDSMKHGAKIKALVAGSKTPVKYDVNLVDDIIREGSVCL